MMKQNIHYMEDLYSSSLNSSNVDNGYSSMLMFCMFKTLDNPREIASLIKPSCKLFFMNISFI